MLKKLEAILLVWKLHRHRRKVYERTRNEILSMSTRELNDLGISRFCASRLAHEESMKVTLESIGGVFLTPGHEGFEAVVWGKSASREPVVTMDDRVAAKG